MILMLVLKRYEKLDLPKLNTVCTKARISTNNVTVTKKEYEYITNRNKSYISRKIPAGRMSAIKTELL